MANPTRQEILEAHNALGELDAAAWSSAEDQGEMQLIDTWKKRILKALPPKPQTAMNEIEWDDDKHYLAEAEHPEYGTVIMLGVGPCSGDIRITRDKERGALWQVVDPSELTPTGRKFELKEKNNV